MSNTAPVAIPDYESQEAWIEFVSMFPDEEQKECPSFQEVKHSLDSFCEESTKQGLSVHRVYIDAGGWLDWVNSNNQPASRKTLSLYAAYKLAKEMNGE